MLLLLLACTPEPAGPTWYGDVQPIVEGRCVGCHADGAIAPYPIETYADAVELGAALRERVDDRSMPPWKAAPGYTAYRDDPSLTDEQIATIDAWVDAGMPEGDPGAPGAPLASVSHPLPRADETLTLPEPYTPSLTPDEYRCFPIEWERAGTSFVTGFEVHPDATAIVHHVAAFLVRPDGIAGPDVADTFRGWDAEDADPGYSCFGGPSRTGAELDVPIQQLAQWVPGNGAILFPEGVGLEVPEGSLVVLQVHYNLAAGTEPDQTSVDFMVEDDAERLGAFAPWLSASWPFGLLIVPAGAQGASYVAEGDPRSFFELVIGDQPDLSGGFDIHAAMLHMHRLGRSGTIRLDHADGTSQTLLQVDDWDFDWQLTYAFADAAPFVDGDRLYLECVFDNDTDADVSWGEGSDDEMCVGNLLVSAPR